jgi:hypothetical protein
LPAFFLAMANILNLVANSLMDGQSLALSARANSRNLQPWGELPALFGHLFQAAGVRSPQS